MPSPNPSQDAAREAPKANRGARGEPESLAEQVESIRSEVQQLTRTVGKIATSQFGEAQASAEDTIRRNPFVAVAIAAALGFLYAAIRR